jgi:hypothetical protein
MTLLTPPRLSQIQQTTATQNKQRLANLLLLRPAMMLLCHGNSSSDMALKTRASKRRQSPNNALVPMTRGMLLRCPGLPQLPTDQANYGSIELNGDGESAVGMDVDVAEM